MKFTEVGNSIICMILKFVTLFFNSWHLMINLLDVVVIFKQYISKVLANYYKATSDVFQHYFYITDKEASNHPIKLYLIL